MMNSTGLAQQQAAVNQASNQYNQLLQSLGNSGQLPWAQYNDSYVLGVAETNDYGMLANVVQQALPKRHTAKELTAFALAWAFGDETLAPLLADKAAVATGDLRIPTGLDALRLDQTQPTRLQLVEAWALTRSQDWRWRLGGLAILVFDFHCGHWLGFP
jgi:hypothetical protein